MYDFIGTPSFVRSVRSNPENYRLVKG